MISSTLFRKHFAIAAATILVFIFLGTFLGFLGLNQIIARVEPGPPLIVAKLIEEIGHGNIVQGAKRLHEILDKDFPFAYVVLDENRKVRFATADLPTEITALPEAPYQSKTISMRGHGPGALLVYRFPGEEKLYVATWMNPKFDPMNSHYGDRPPHHRDGPPPRFDGPPPQFDDRPPHPGDGSPRGPLWHPETFFPIIFFLLVLMVLAGIAFSLFLIFHSLREHVDAADRVIQELQSGNLRARFPIRKNDEIGRAMQRFNKMADEIESLVERLRAAERARSLLLTELTHDLRTPVASLGSLTETIFSNSKLDPKMEELADLVTREIDYIQRLVEDLLLLAQINEPRYKLPQKPTDLLALFESEGPAIAAKNQGSKSVDIVSSTAEALVLGDEHLLLRLIRNALENAISFAKRKVHVDIHAQNDGYICIRISDDGPGFPPEIIENYGERRGQRLLDERENGRLSLGLGSVIIRTIVELHQGRLQVANSPEGGAILEIYLPLGTGTKLLP